MCKSSTHILSHGLISSKAVVILSQDRTVPVKILNPGSNYVVIPKGRIIAKFSQLTEEYQVRHVNCIDNVPVVQNINLVKHCPTEHGDSINCEFLDNFEINPNLKDYQKITLNHLLCDNKEVFVTTDKPNRGFTDIAQHHIILKPDMRPLHQKPCRLTPHKKEVLRHHLDELLRQGVICELNATEQEQETSFTRIEQLLLTSEVLAFPRFDLQFFLAVDSSMTGIGCMFYQKHPSDTGEQIRVVRFGSKSLISSQKSYRPTKLELLGVVTSIVDCARYLRGDRFTVECDHQALRSLFQNQFKGAIYDRWLAVLQQFNFDIKYKPAADMQVPDALSRIENASLLDVNAEESLNENDPHFAKLSTDEIETGYTADTKEESSKLTFKHEHVGGID
ncbi:unnamed protein product [Mytilus coruscus]|uniref:Reverse transcriptase RNase H-like domain-containing protein n=1 Tax=Mytilus coruscus TaxID=42192 RepID=A0A6J8B8Y7_MYTCO|nr:unnamed protein product [Mytilus coruscus]